MKKLILTGIMLLMVLGVSGCRNNNDEANSIKVGYFNNVTHAQALLMKSEKSLENTFGKDINVKWTAFNAGPAEVEALFAGDIDIGYIGPVPAISANVKSNGDVQILSGAAKGGAILIRREGAQISGVKDLAGKTVAIPQIGNTQHLSLLKLLEDSGLKPVTEGGNVTVSAVTLPPLRMPMLRMRWHGEMLMLHWFRNRGGQHF
ncbi:MAG: ABC transporter substrate-binding protein [Clostridium sp.]